MWRNEIYIMGLIWVDIMVGISSTSATWATSIEFVLKMILLIGIVAKLMNVIDGHWNCV